MRKIQYRLLHNRKKKLNAQGTALIQVEAYLEKRKIYLSTHIYVKPEQWDKKQERVRLHPHAEELNRMLEEFVLSLQWEELKAWKRGLHIGLELFKEKQNGRMRHTDDFITLGRHWVENSSTKSEGTRKNLLTTLKLMKEFRTNLAVTDVTYTFLIEFESFMYNRGYAINTIAKHMRHLKTFVNEAMNQGILSPEEYPFRKYKIKTTAGKHEFLLPQEIMQLERLSLSSQDAHLQHSLDAFLFCCYTGLRYSDFIRLSAENIICPEHPGEKWLVFKTVKTGVEIRLPLYLLFNGKALHYIERSKEEVEAFFHPKSNSQVNKELAKIACLAKLDKHISFHTARHTNASLLVYQGAQLTTVQKLLGHRDIKTTQVYGEIFPETIVNDLIQCIHKRGK